MDDLEKIREAFKDHAMDDERHFKELREMLGGMDKKLDEAKEALKPLTEAYSGILFSRKFLVGLAGIILAVGAIGAGIIWVVNAALSK